MKRLLVTGVSGLLGVNLALLAGETYQVTGVLRGNHAMPIPGRTPFTTLYADLTQPGQVERVLEQADPDVIIHCAALTNVDRCETHPEEAHQANVLLPAWLARAAAQSGARLVHISTDAVFDGARGGYTEEDTPHSINVYADTKLAGERAVMDANADALIARVNFYGWSWTGSRSLAEFFFQRLSAGETVQGYADLIFCPLLVNDLAAILLDMVECNLQGMYHVVSSESQSKFAFGGMLARVFGFDENLVLPASSRMAANMKAPRSPLLTLSSEKLEKALHRSMPAQLPAMRRFAALQQQGYPQTLRAVFAETGASLQRGGV